jgi:hypothetical protein
MQVEVFGDIQSTMVQYEGLAYSVYDACPPSVTAKPESARSCEAVVALASASARGELEARAILGAAARLGLSNPAVAALRLRHDAASTLRWKELFPPDMEWGSCKQQKLFRQRFKTVSKQGFLDYHQERAMDLGLSMQELASVEAKRRQPDEARRLKSAPPAPEKKSTQ